MANNQQGRHRKGEQRGRKQLGHRHPPSLASFERDQTIGMTGTAAENITTPTNSDAATENTTR